MAVSESVGEPISNPPVEKHDDWMKFSEMSRPQTKLRQARYIRAGDGIRTHDNNVGNVVLYQLSYARTSARIPACRLEDILNCDVEGRLY